MDKENVIKGLKCCASMNGNACKECPYSSECIEVPYQTGTAHLAVDVLAMLKEQEPRVMTADEVQEDELVWIEVPQSDEIWPALLRETDWFDHPTWAMRGYALGGYYLHSGYGRDWRCWTAKPTEDQRLAVKWE